MVRKATSFVSDGDSLLVTTPERTHIDWNVPDNYEIMHRVGGGKYSEVRGDATLG